jgi:glycosyltransferase involved in cell wall biosynthesis
MRIAYICADLGIPVFGNKGCSIHVQEVVRAMQARGAEVEIFTMRPEGTPPADLATVRVHALPRLPKGDRASREQAALTANDHLRALLHREAPFDLIYERYSLWSYAGMEYARSADVPGFLEVNAPLIEEQAKYRELIDRKNAEKTADRCFAAATALLAVSREVAMYLLRHPTTCSRVYVVPNGVNPSRFPHGVAPSLPTCPGTWTVGFVGTLKPWHGLSVLVEAFAQLHEVDPGTRLVIVGDGPARERLEADLEAYGLREAAHLHGAVEPAAVPGMLASFDVAVAPYPPLECFYFSPLKVYEYMAAGLPVVASRLGQLEELIEHEVNGLLFTAGSATALAESLQRLRKDPGLCARLGVAARATVLGQHTWDSVVARIFHLADLQRLPTPCIEVG